MPSGGRTSAESRRPAFRTHRSLRALRGSQRWPRLRSCGWWCRSRSPFVLSIVGTVSKKKPRQLRASSRMRGAGVRPILSLRGRHRTPGYDNQGNNSNPANVQHGFTVSFLGGPLAIISLFGPFLLAGDLGPCAGTRGTRSWFNGPIPSITIHTTEFSSCNRSSRS